MEHADNQINLGPILFPISLFLRLWANQCGCRSVSLALGKGDNPKVVCLNATKENALV